MVDMMSGGRLVFGVGSGYLAHEFVGYDADPKEKRDRFNENLDIVKRLMAGETLSYKGKFSKSEKVVLNVRPHEGRVPPIYVAVLAREARLPRRQAAQPHLHGALCLVQGLRRHRHDAGGVPQGPPEAGLAARRRRPRLHPAHLRRARPTRRRRPQCKAAYDLYVDTRLYAKKHVYEDIIANGICLFGSVETVAEKMCRAARDGHPPRRHAAQFRRPRSPRLVERSMTLFAREVMPAVAGPRRFRGAGLIGERSCRFARPAGRTKRRRPWRGRRQVTKSRRRKG